MKLPEILQFCSLFMGLDTKDRKLLEKCINHIEKLTTNVLFCIKENTLFAVTLFSLDKKGYSINRDKRLIDREKL